MTNEPAACGTQQPRDWRGEAAIADARVELAAVRTGLALERTRMSADRALMVVMRTSLALIGFLLVAPNLDLPGSLAATLAVLLFAVGVAAIIRMALRAGLFG